MIRFVNIIYVSLFLFWSVVRWYLEVDKRFIVVILLFINLGLGLMGVFGNFDFGIKSY